MASRQDHKVPNGIGEPHDGGLVDDDDDDAIAVDHSDSQAASESKHPHQANGHRIDDGDHDDEDGDDDDGDFDEEDESLFHMVNGVRYPRVPISKELGENVILVRDISKGTCVSACAPTTTVTWHIDRDQTNERTNER